MTKKIQLLMIATLTMVVTIGSIAPAFGQGRRGSSVRTRGRNATDVKQTLQQLIGATSESVCKVTSGGVEIVLGTVVSADGLVVTKHSEIEFAENIVCVMKSGNEFAAEIVAVQSSYDLALLRLNTTGLTPVDLNNEAVEVTAGSIVLTSNELGEPLSMGVVSVDPRRFNMRQRRISRRGYLGVECRERDAGLTISRITRRSAAQRAGLKRNDVISKCQGEDVTSLDNLIERLSKKLPGDEVELMIMRDEESFTVTAKLGEDPGSSNQQQDQWGGGPFSTRRFGFPQVISHDCVVRPEQCGSPLLNTDGTVIGVNIARALRVATYAVPSGVVAEFVATNKDAGK